MYKLKTLKNGLKILQVPRKSDRSVLVDIFVKTGSRSEDKKINGISHFLEHLFFKGSQKFPTAQALSHALDAIGAEYNANTGKEHTQYYVKAAKKHFRFVFETLTDVMQNPIFASDEIEREKGVIIEEINMYEDTPIRHVDDVLEEYMWPRQPLGRNIAGTKQIIKRMSRQEIVTYKETHYRPRNMLIAVSGSFSEKQLNQLVKKYWEVVPNKKVPSWKKAKDRQVRPEIQIAGKKTEQYHLDIGFRGYDFNHKNFVAQVVLSAILGGGMSSRLFTEVRERRGLAYYVRASGENYQDTGLFLVKAGVRLEALPEAVETIMRLLRKIKSEKVGSAELSKAKEYLKGTLTLSLESSESLLDWYLTHAAFRRKILTPREIFKMIDRITASDVRRVARELFQNKKLNFVAVGPNKYKAKLKKLLKF